jgi:hypothetical protein
MRTGVASPRVLLPILGAALLGGSSFSARSGQDSAPTALVLTIEEAIETAKRCVLERNVPLAGSFIESARLERNPRGDLGPYWVVTWAYSREVKGGQVFVSVFQSRTCELRYGE